MKTPEACRNLEDIRVGIDTLDKEIIEAFGRRLAYVKAAAQFKPTEESIAAPERVGAMVPQRREWAIAAGLDPDFIGPLFGQIIYWFIGQQIYHWRANRGQSGS